MTTFEDPWSGLTASGVNARRVNRDGHHDFFWIVGAKSEPGMLLRLTPDTPKVGPLPRMRNLDLSYSEIAGQPSLLLLLRDEEQRELFAGLCADIVNAGEGATDNHDALSRAIRRTMRWHHLLRGGKTGLLSLEEQRGLLGELQFLKRLIDLIGPRAAIEAWKGPSGASKDFELDGCLVEVKARRGAAKPFVHISSEDQLSDVDGCRVFLTVGAVDAAVKPQGQTLTDYVAEIEKILSAADLETASLWEQAIEASGFDFADDYSDRRWTLGKTLQFEVSEGFPRIAAPPPQGVSGIRYSIALDACTNFAVEAGLVDQFIVERNGPWTN
ncbi:PD-(D/E)XK motif protein [Sphingomonas sp. YL-JM2C]